jgi:YfiH family protein
MHHDMPTLPPLLEAFPALPALPGFRHILTTRVGGVSAGPYAACNMGLHVDDEPTYVAENRRRVATTAGFAADALVTGQQVHGVELAWVTPTDRGRGAMRWEEALPTTDGLLVQALEVPVAILTADCAAVLLVAPHFHTLAVLHAGWRGAIGGIAARAVRQMQASGIPPTDVWAAIGPTLCPTCLTINPTIAAAVTEVAGPAPLREIFGQPHLDLGALVRLDLVRAGVPASQISAHPDCTRCTNDRWFSYRGQGGHCGRMALVAWWDA